MRCSAPRHFTRKFVDVLVPKWCYKVKGGYFLWDSPAATLRTLPYGLNRKENIAVWRKRLAGAYFFTERQRKWAAAYGAVPEDWPVLGELSSDMLFAASKKEASWPALTTKYNFSYNRTVMFDLNNFPRFVKTIFPPYAALPEKRNAMGGMCFFTPSGPKQ